MGVPHAEAWAPWPSGDYWVVGMLAPTPEELTVRLGIQFTSAAEDLGESQLAVIPDDRVGQIWLVSLTHAPEPGTDVRVDLAITRDEALHALWQALHLDIRDFKWVNPYPAHPWSNRLGRSLGLAAELTPRESQIVGLLGDGVEAPAIARTLGIARSTVESHLARLRLKFRVKDNGELRSAIRLSRPRPPLSA